MAIDSRSRGEISVEYSRRRSAIVVSASTHSLLPRASSTMSGRLACPAIHLPLHVHYTTLTR